MFFVNFIILSSIRKTAVIFKTPIIIGTDLKFKFLIFFLLLVILFKFILIFFFKFFGNLKISFKAIVFFDFLEIISMLSNEISLFPLSAKDFFFLTKFFLLNP